MLGIALFVYALLAYIPVGLPDTRWGLQIAASGQPVTSPRAIEDGK